MANRPQFPGQHRNEQVIFKKRRHWYVLLKWVVPPALLFIAAAGVGLIAGLALGLNVFLWAGLILLLSIGPLGFTVWRFLDWENDHYILTNRRILHIERVYFLFESRSEANLDKIQDVTVRMPNMIANVLHFGNLEIETASTAGQIKFESIPQPRKAQREVFQAAGLPVMDMKEAEEWQASELRIMRPLEMFAQMLYPVYPRTGDVRVWRKHWFVLLTNMALPVVAAIALFVVGFLVLRINRQISVVPVSEEVALLVLAILLLIIIARIAWIAIDWHNDLYVLTPTHVLDIEKRPFTSEFRREANLSMIQNVSYEQPGFIAKLLDFGNTKLETAGKKGEFTFDNVPKPREVQNIIIERLDAARAEARRRKQEERRAEIEEIVRQMLRAPQKADSGGSPGSP